MYSARVLLLFLTNKITDVKQGAERQRCSLVKVAKGLGSWMEYTVGEPVFVGVKDHKKLQLPLKALHSAAHVSQASESLR